MKNRSFLLTASLAIVAGLGVGVGAFIHHAFADKSSRAAAVKKGDAKNEVAGRVTAVDAVKHTITVLVNATKSNPGEEKTFDVAREAKIAVGDSREAKLGDLKQKQLVILTLSAESKVVAIRTPAVSATKGAGGVYGVLKSEKGNSITLTVQIGKGQPPEDRTFEVASDARIVLDETKEGKLADVPLGAHVSLRLSEDNKAIAVFASGPSVHGALRAVDDGKKTITLTINAGKGNPGEEKTFTLAKTATVTQDKVKLTKLTDLVIGTRIGITLTVDQKEVLRVQAATEGKPGPTIVRGMVSVVNVEKKTLTITINLGKGSVPEDRTYEVPTTVPITIDLGKGAKLGDLAADARVTVTLSPESVVTAIKAVGPSIPALMQSVDAGKNTIKVLINPGKGNTGDEKTYDLVKDARITFPMERAGKLADLQAGSRVSLQLSVDKRTVIGITVERE